MNTLIFFHMAKHFPWVSNSHSTLSGTNIIMLTFQVKTWQHVTLTVIGELRSKPRQSNSRATLLDHLPAFTGFILLLSTVFQVLLFLGRLISLFSNRILCACCWLCLSMLSAILIDTEFQTAIVSMDQS